MGAPDPARDCSHRRCRRTRADRRSEPRDRCGSRVRSLRTTRTTLAVTSAMTLRCSRRKRLLAMCGADLVFSCPPSPSMRWGVVASSVCLDVTRSHARRCIAPGGARITAVRRDRVVRARREGLVFTMRVLPGSFVGEARAEVRARHELLCSKRRGGESVRRSCSRRRRSRLAIVGGRAREVDRARRHDMSIDWAESSCAPRGLCDARL
jgi:hypothetical protein